MHLVPWVVLGDTFSDTYFDLAGNQVDYNNIVIVLNSTTVLYYQLTTDCRMFRPCGPLSADKAKQFYTADKGLCGQTFL